MQKLIIQCFISAGFLLVGCSHNLTESQVSQASIEAFKKAYPNSIAKWEKENGNYEVNFKQNGKTLSAIIKMDGTIVETETDIPISTLPSNAQSHVRDNYNGATIKEASKIEKANGDLNFEVLVNGKDIMFDANGKFIQEAQN